VDDIADVLDAAFEHPERGRIGEHQPGGLRPDRVAQRRQIDVALAVGGNFTHDVAAHCRGGRVGSVRSVRHHDFLSRMVAAVAVIGANHRHTGKLALRAGHRREAHTRHAGDLLQHLLQLPEAGEESLPGLLGRKRMAGRKLGKQRKFIARARVVFHGARAERIKMRVD